MAIACRRFVFGEGWLTVGTASSGASLPVLLTGQLGTYSYGGQAFHCQEPGLYLFLNQALPMTSQYRILSPALGASGFNLDAILEGLAEWCACGDFDMFNDSGVINSINIAYNAALHRQPVITCEYTCKFAQALLAQRGVASRICRVLSAEDITPWPGDYGHVLLEVANGGDWVLYDFLSDRTWGLSFADLMAHLDMLDIYEMFGDAKESPINKTERSAYFKCFLGGTQSPARQQEWDDRIFGIPFIDVATGGSVGYNPPGKSFGRGVALPTGFSLASSETAWRAIFYA